MISKTLKRKDKLLCTIDVVARETKYNIEDIIRLLDLYSEQSALIIENAVSYAKIKEFAIYDELTKLYNRRHLMKLGKQQYDESVKEGSLNYAVAMLDIDNFKMTNDTYGHLFGDEVIKNVAALCKRYMPSNSIMGRYGGEEFIIFFNGRSLDNILKSLEILRDKASQYKYNFMEYHGVQVTISIGVAVKSDYNQQLIDIINNSDKALYSAKRAGKNCINIFG